MCITKLDSAIDENLPPTSKTATSSSPLPISSTNTIVAGIRWAKTPGEIDRLNEIVAEKVKKIVKENLETPSSVLSPEIDAVLNKNQIVYHKRITAFPILISLISALMIAYNANSIMTPLAVLISFIWYDFFSGVLHVVLDNPDFISLPLLGQPCLEFQWHHHIPNDLASKSFLEVCGDLNVIIGILSVLYLCPGVAFVYRSPTAVTLVGSKILMAYFGQLCHCMSHTPSNRRPVWVTQLQQWGIMISPIAHGKHHRHYDSNFCIGSGVCNPVLTWLMTNITSNGWVWLMVFSVSVVLDVPLFLYGLKTLGGFQ